MKSYHVSTLQIAKVLLVSVNVDTINECMHACIMYMSL